MLSIIGQKTSRNLQYVGQLAQHLLLLSLGASFNIAFLCGDIYGRQAQEEPSDEKKLIELGKPVAISFIDIEKRGFKLAAEDLEQLIFRYDAIGSYVYQAVLKDYSFLPWNYFHGDWQSVKGNHLNYRTYPSLALEIFADPVLRAHANLLSTDLRNQIERLLLHDYKRMPSTIEKLSFLDTRVTAQSQRLDFEEVIDVGTIYPKEGSLYEKYLGAHYEVPLKMNVFLQPGAPDWWGFCDRLAIANLNPQSSQMLAEVGGRLCGNVMFSKYELMDILTFLHKMPEDMPTIGKNRGNISEPESVSKELLAYEELTGTRPIGPPERFVELLRTYIKEKGKGLLIDEASSKHDPNFIYSAIWNRPVFQYSVAEQRFDVEVDRIGLLLFLRNVDHFLPRPSDEPTLMLIRQELENLEKIALEADALYARLLNKTLLQRSEDLKLPLNLNLKEEQSLEIIAKMYEAKAVEFSQSLDRLKDRVQEGMALVKERKGRLGSFIVGKVEVEFPRERNGWHDKGLSSRAYHYVRLAAKDAQASWLQIKGDYPPDLIRLPDGFESPANLGKLKDMLSACVSFENLGKAVHSVAKMAGSGSAANPLSLVEDPCVLYYFDQQEVSKLLAPKDSKAFLAKWQKGLEACQSERVMFRAIPK